MFIEESTETLDTNTADIGTQFNYLIDISIPGIIQLNDSVIILIYYSRGIHW